MNSQTKTNKRILALDILRGVTIAGMIMVNNPGTWGHIYAPLRHAEWNGLTHHGYLYLYLPEEVQFRVQSCSRHEDIETYYYHLPDRTCHRLVLQILLLLGRLP